MRTPEPISTNDSLLRQPWLLLALIFVSLIAGLLAILTFQSTKVALALVAGIMVLATFFLSGNFRLALLYSLLLLAPLAAGKRFMVIPHMGGAAAISIDIVDPFLLALFALQLRDWYRGYRAAYRMPRAMWYWVALMVLGVGTVLFDDYRSLAGIEVIRMVKLLVLVLVVVNEVVRRRQIIHALIALLLGVLLQASLALIQYTTDLQLGLEFLGEGSPEVREATASATLRGVFVYRPGGLLGHGNLLGAYLALLLPAAIALLLTKGRSFLKLIAIAAVVLGLPALVLTLSRTAWISFAVAFMAVLILGMYHPVSRRRYLGARVGIVVLTAVVAVALSPKIVQRLYQSDPGAVNVRLEWLEVAKNMVVDKPLFGVGLNAYVFEQLPYGKDKSPEAMNARYGKQWPAVHSTWALVWAEQGTIGFLLFVAMHLAIIRVGVKNLKIRDPVLHAIGAGLLCGFGAIMIDGLASFFLRFDQHSRVFWIVTALILALGYWRRTNEEYRPVRADLVPSPSPTEFSPADSRWLPVRGPRSANGGQPKWLATRKNSLAKWSDGQSA